MFLLQIQHLSLNTLDTLILASKKFHSFDFFR